MARRIIVIGSGAAGMSAASAAREASSDAQITVFTEDEDIAYSPCAIPWGIEGRSGWDEIVMHTPEFYEKERGIKVLTGTRVDSVDGDGKTVTAGGQTYPYDSLVIATGGIRSITFENGLITASCGVSLSALSVFAMEHGKKGLAFAFGIPGTVGGGVYMNAGAYGGELSDCLEHAVCIDAKGEKVTLSGEDLRLSYRHSRLQEEELLLLSATFRCEDGDPKEIKGEMDKNMAARKEKQPLEYPSCGSAFKRPTGYYAGALIQAAGLKGFSMGGAQVSEKHAGFVINKGDATADDVKALLAHVQKTVYDQSGVLLEPEIQIL